MKVPKPIKVSSGNYYIRLRLGGEEIGITASTAKEATRKAELIKSEHRNGKRAASSDKSLGELIDAYIKKYEPDLSPSTIRGYSSIRKNRFVADMKKRPKDINFQAMINNELAQGKSVKTVKNGWGAVTTAMSDAGIPVPSVKFPAEAKDDDLNFLEPEEIPLFLAAAEGDSCEVELLLELHSLRQSEVLKVVKNKQYDLKTGEIIVSGSIVPDKNNDMVEKNTNKSKAGRRRIPIMIPRLADLLHGEVQLHASETVLAHCHRVCQKAGIRDVTSHGLRHTFASLAYSLGFSEQLIMLWGGWDDPGTMHRIYIHLTQREKSKAQNEMKAFYAPKTAAQLEAQAAEELKAWAEKYGSMEKFKEIVAAINAAF